MDSRLDAWHRVVQQRDMVGLRTLLHPQVKFSSPAFLAPKEGADTAFFILSNVIEIFHEFTYHRQWIEGDDFALEFSATVGDKRVKGIDLIHWDAEGLITDFEVMIRPLSGLAALAEEMNRRFAAAGLL